MKERLKSFPGTRVIARDLAKNPVPQITRDEDVGALYGPPETHTPEMAALAELSDQLCLEIIEAHEIVVNTTMYNMTIPSIFKSYLDLMVRARKTFRFSPAGPVPMVKNKKILFIVTKGGIYSKGPQQSQDFLEPYLKEIFSFIGITDSSFVTAEGLAIDQQTRKKAVAKATASLAELAHGW